MFYEFNVLRLYSFRAIGTLAMEKYPNLDNLFLLELGIDDNFWRKVGLLEMFWVTLVLAELFGDALAVADSGYSREGVDSHPC